MQRNNQMTIKTAQQIFDVGPNASLFEIKKKYKALALQNHPDKNHHADAGEKFKAIQEAYTILCERAQQNPSLGIFSQPPQSKFDKNELDKQKFFIEAKTIFTCFKSKEGDMPEFGDILRALSERKFSLVKKIGFDGYYDKSYTNIYGANLLHFALYHDGLSEIDNIFGENNLDAQCKITINGKKYNAMSLAQELMKGQEVIDLLSNMFHFQPDSPQRRYS